MLERLVGPADREDRDVLALALELEHLGGDERLGDAREALQDVAEPRGALTRPPAHAAQRGLLEQALGRGGRRRRSGGRARAARAIAGRERVSASSISRRSVARVEAIRLDDLEEPERGERAGADQLLACAGPSAARRPSACRARGPRRACCSRPCTRRASTAPNQPASSGTNVRTATPAAFARLRSAAVSRRGELRAGDRDRLPGAPADASTNVSSTRSPSSPPPVVASTIGRERASAAEAADRPCRRARPRRRAWSRSRSSASAGRARAAAPRSGACRRRTRCRRRARAGSARARGASSPASTPREPRPGRRGRRGGRARRARRCSRRRGERASAARRRRPAAACPRGARSAGSCRRPRRGSRSRSAVRSARGSSAAAACSGRCRPSAGPGAA